jgi:hypothetical protein
MATRRRWNRRVCYAGVYAHAHAHAHACTHAYRHVRKHAHACTTHVRYTQVSKIHKYSQTHTHTHTHTHTYRETMGRRKTLEDSACIPQNEAEACMCVYLCVSECVNVFYTGTVHSFPEKNVYTVCGWYVCMFVSVCVCVCVFARARARNVYGQLIR